MGQQIPRRDSKVSLFCNLSETGDAEHRHMQITLMTFSSSNSEVKLPDPTTDHSTSLLSSLEYSVSPASPESSLRLLLLVLPTSRLSGT